MTGFVLKRFLLLIPVVLGISIVVFLVMAAIPGDPALAMLGPYATEDRVLELRRSLGLDRNLVLRYLTWLSHVLRGDLGRAYSLDRPVLDVLAERLGPTLLLSGTALTIGTFLGLSAGLGAAVGRGKSRDRALTLGALLGLSTPAFWLALLMALVFGVWLGIYPVSGMRSAFGARAGGVFDVLSHLALPALVLALVSGGVIARLTRNAMLDVLGKGYVQMARAKGLNESIVLYRHAFRAALPQIVPVIGLQAGFVLGGAVYVETVFQWPGVGRMLVEAIAKRDLLLVQGGVLVVAAAYVLVNLAADIVQRALDPRVQA